jgi:bacterioferritin-associated ferredoxin
MPEIEKKLFWCMVLKMSLKIRYFRYNRYNGAGVFMVICHCVGVTDRAIVQLAHEGVGTVAEVMRRTGAGRCCAPCRSEIAAVLQQATSDAAPVACASAACEA